jgi:O-antigen/teichoic acid export membrane protein
MIRVFLKDMLKYAPAQIVPGLVGFIAIPILTRLFPPDDYGNYILVIATVNIMVTMVGWLSTSIIRFYPAYKKEYKLDIFYSTITKLLGMTIGLISCLYLLMLWALKHQLNSKLHSLLLIGTLLFIAQGTFLVLQYILRAKRNVNWFTIFAVWNSVSSLGLGLLLVMLFKCGVEGLLLGSFLAIFLSVPFLWHFSINTARTTIKSISKNLASEMAKYGLPLVAGNLAAWILSLSDRYVLEYFLGSAQVGLYSASYGLAERSIILINTLFMLAAGPISINIWERDGIKASQDFVAKQTRYYLLICVPAVVGLSVLAKPIISLLTPEVYHEGYIIIPFVALGAFFLGLQQCFQSGLLFYKKTRFIMICVIISAFINLGLNFIFVPYYGYKAAAMITLVSYFFLLVSMIIGSRTIYTWEFPFNSLIKTTSASIVMGIIIYKVINNNSSDSIRLSIILLICLLGFIIYSILLFSLKEIQTEELNSIKKFIKC